MLEKFLEITTTRSLKTNFPVWQLFKKNLPQRYWPQYLGNYTDYSDGRYFVVMCIYIYIYSGKHNITNTNFFHDNPYLQKESYLTISKEIIVL